MYKVLKTQLKVRKEDREYIDDLIYARHQMWNQMVEEFNPRYNEKKYPGATEIDRFIKTKHPNVPGNVRQQARKDYQEAWKQTFRIKNRKEPRFRGIKYSNSVHCQKNNGLRINGNKFQLTRNRKIELCEEFPDKGSGWMTEFTLSRRSGKYYVSFIWKEEVPLIENGDGEIGLDFGFIDFFTDDKGNKYNLPDSYVRQTMRIKKLQRILSKKQAPRKGVQSNNWKRVRNKLTLAWNRLNNIKKDFIEKLTFELCKQNKLIAIEDLNLMGLRKISYRSGRRKMNQNCFGSFRNRLKQKSNRFKGVIVYEAHTRFASSQLCSVCGFKNVKMKKLKHRELICDDCGVVIDRDQNAAINLIQKARFDLNIGSQV